MIMNIFATLFTHMVTVCALVAGSHVLKHQLLLTFGDTDCSGGDW